MRPLSAVPLIIAREFLVFFVWVYRYTLGLLFPASCRYEPSCSQYAIDALRKYGPFRGTVKAAGRIGRCHPYSKHPYHDPA